MYPLNNKNFGLSSVIIIINISMHIINCINVYYIFMLSTKTRRFFRLDQKIDIHLTNVAIQKTAPDYDPEKVGT